jgi:hypothetical protein
MARPTDDDRYCRPSRTWWKQMELLDKQLVELGELAMNDPAGFFSYKFKPVSDVETDANCRPASKVADMDKYRSKSG